MSTKVYHRALLVLICGLAAVGLAFAGGTQQPTSGEMKEITLQINADPGVIDPVANWLYDVTFNQWVPLVSFDYEAVKVVPAGATDWSVSADGKTWTFKIRRGWNWSNGDPVTAHDYEYAFQQIVNPETASPIVSRIMVIENAPKVSNGELPLEQLGVKAIDDYTLEIKLSQRVTWFLTSLTSIGHAVPRGPREEFGPEWTKPGNIVTNGPYIITEWEIDNLVVLEKNPNYYDADNVDIDKVTLLVVPELSTAMALYETGEIDTTDVPLEDLDRVKADPVLSKEFYTGPRYVINYWGIDSTRPPFDNVLVRKAFAAAIDKVTIVEKIARGGQVPAPTVTPPGSFGHIPASEGVGIDFDPAQARAWLAEAGFPGGRGLAPIVIGVSTAQLHLNTAQAIQKMWQDYLGVTAELRVWEGGGYNDAAGAGAFNVWRNGWGMDYPDAHNALGEIFRSRPVTGDAAFGRFLTIPELDRLIDAAAVELDTTKRYQMYKEAERLLVEEYAATYPLFYYAVNIVTKPRISRPMVPSMNQSWWLWTVNE